MARARPLSPLPPPPPPLWLSRFQLPLKFFSAVAIVAIAVAGTATSTAAAASLASLAANHVVGSYIGWWSVLVCNGLRQDAARDARERVTLGAL